MSTAKKRLIVERQYALTPTPYATFLAALQAAAFQVADAGKVGSVASVSVADRSTAFSNSEHGDTPSDTEQMWGELLELYDASRAALVSVGIGSPTDLQIKTEMLFRLHAVRESTNSYTGVIAA